MNVAVHSGQSPTGLPSSGPRSDQSGGGACSSEPRSVASNDRSGFNYISICTGGGGLDLGFELAIPSARPVCLVEREAFSVAHLVAAMQAGVLADAPVWSDVRTFRGREWRGLVDGLIGGIPCQPHSMAGKRGGSTDERDLWSATRRIIAQARPWFVLIENVAGMLVAGAVGPKDQSQGHDEIAGAQRVRRDLRRLGYAVEGGLFTAAEVGAPHERKRVFILGLSNAIGGGHARRAQGTFRREIGRDVAERNSGAVADTGSARPQGCEQCGPSGERNGSAAHGSAAELRDAPMGNTKDDDGRGQQQPKSKGCGRTGPARADEGLGNAARERRREGQSEPSLRSRRKALGGHDFELGHAAHARSGQLSVGRQDGQADPDTGRAGTNVPDATRLQRQGVQRFEPDGNDAGIARDWDIPIFPPGPSERDAWAAISANAAHLEPAICRVAHGLAAGVDNTRVDELRMLGNGVVPLEAAHAIRSLLAAHRAAGTQTNHPALMEAAE